MHEEGSEKERNLTTGVRKKKATTKPDNLRGIIVLFERKLKGKKKGA